MTTGEKRKQQSVVSKPQRQAEVLKHLATAGNLSEAARRCGVPPGTAYHWLEHDEVFAKQMRDVLDTEYADHLDEISRQRLEDPQGNRGSDILLMFEKKAIRPHIYRDYPPVDDSAANTLRELRKLAQTLKAAPVAAPKETEVIEGAEAERLLAARRGKAGEGETGDG